MEYHHLSKIVAAYPDKAIARFATFKIRKNLLEEGLATDEEIIGSLLICRKCSQKLIPGQNCDVYIEKSSKKYINCAVYLCNLCKGKTRFNGVPKNVKKYNSKAKKTDQKINQVISPVQEIPDTVPTPNLYAQTGMRNLNKQEKKKTLLESFFESTQNKSIYNLFH